MAYFGRGRLLLQLPSAPSPAVPMSGTNSAGEGAGGTQYGITAKKDGEFIPMTTNATPTTKNITHLVFRRRAMHTGGFRRHQKYHFPVFKT